MISLKKYVVSDLTGRDLFYFELFKLDETDDTLSFDSNVKFQLKHKKIIGLIELLLSNHLPEQTKDAVAQQLFNSILKEKEYQKFYAKFVNHCEEKCGTVGLEFASDFLKPKLDVFWWNIFRYYFSYFFLEFFLKSS